MKPQETETVVEIETNPKGIENEYGTLMINQDVFQVVKYADPELLVISGIHEKHARGEKMTIGITLPNGKTEPHTLTMADKGKYHFTLELTPDFKPGSYSVVADPKWLSNWAHYFHINKIRSLKHLLNS